jgi:hypothetical protein
MSYTKSLYIKRSYLLGEAESMKKLVREKGGDERLKHKVLASVFYEVFLLLLSAAKVCISSQYCRLILSSVSHLPERRARFRLLCRDSEGL